MAGQGIAEGFFDRTIRASRLVGVPASGRSPECGPVGGQVARATVSRGINECLDEVDRVPVDLLPVAREPTRHARENV